MFDDQSPWTVILVLAGGSVLGAVVLDLLRWAARRWKEKRDERKNRIATRPSPDSQELPNVLDIIRKFDFSDRESWISKEIEKLPEILQVALMPFQILLLFAIFFGPLFAFLGFLAFLAQLVDWLL